MSHLVDYAKFGINAATIGFNVLASGVYYYSYYKYERSIYSSQKDYGGTKKILALVAGLFYYIAEFLSQIALIHILISFGKQSKSSVDYSTDQQQNLVKNRKIDEIERITSLEIDRVT